MTKEDIIDLIKDAGYGFLATTDEKQPRVRPVGPYISEDGECLLAILSNARSIKQIKKNPLVEMCFVDRKMSFCRLTGKARISEDAEKRQIVWDNVPPLKRYASGPQDKNFTLVEVDTDSVEAMTQNHREPEKISFK